MVRFATHTTKYVQPILVIYLILKQPIVMLATCKQKS